jgi:hypothetical protein
MSESCNSYTPLWRLRGDQRPDAGRDQAIRRLDNGNHGSRARCWQRPLQGKCRSRSYVGMAVRRVGKGLGADWIALKAQWGDRVKVRVRGRQVD